MSLFVIILVIISGIVGTVLCFIIGVVIVLAVAMYALDEESLDDTDNYSVRS